MQVSVIIPTYNRAQRLGKAIDSVLVQSHQDFELIVVDDGSEDNTDELIENYNSDIVYIRQENSGAAAARNRGIEKARYNLLAFLDSDDWFAENKLKTQIEAMSQNPSCLISHTNEIWYRNGQILNQKLKHRKNSGDIFSRSLELCAVGMSTIMIHKEIFDRYGFFDEGYPCCEDYEFWLRISAEEKFLLVEESLTLKDGGRDDQLSAIYRTGMDKFRIKAIMKTLASGRLTEEQSGIARRELERKCRIYGTGCIKHGRAEEGRYFLNLPETVGRKLTA
ncbi:MAG: glycosyltransferase [Desulfobacterales bacterium]|nr:glycosyltransferase [Desulfobacterales bacterium]